MADNEATISELIPADATHLDDRLETSQVEGVGFVSRSITLDQVATHVATSDQIADVVSDAIDEIPPLTWDNITDKPATFPPTVPIAWDDISGEPSTFPPTIPTGGAIAAWPYLPLTGGTLTGALSGTTAMMSGNITTNGGSVVVDRIGDAVSANLTVAADAAFTAGVTLNGGVNSRWILRKNATAEGGSNTGSDFEISPRTDAGAALPTAVTITRSTGAVTLGGALSGTTATLSTAIPAAEDSTRVATTAWVKANAGGGGASIAVGTTPPVSPVANAMWWNSDAATGGGQLMIFYVDPGGAPGQWVPASPGMSTPTTPGGDFCANQISSMPTVPGSSAYATLVLTQVVSGNSPVACYSTSTGRYTPPAGRFCIYAGYSVSTSQASHAYLRLRKNGTAIQDAVDTVDGVSYYAAPSLSVIVDCNGTDWFDIQGCMGQAVTGSLFQLVFQAFPISGVKGPPGDPGVGLLQTVSYQTGAVATGTGTIPQDDTIPQIGEGTEFMTLAITPRSATSRLIIEVIWNGSSSASNICLALFQDAAANALAVSLYAPPAASYNANISLRHTMISGTISPTTFRVRVGASGAATVTFNGAGGARQYGGVMASSIVIQEVL